MSAERIADQVVNRINRHYDLDQKFVEQVRKYIEQAVIDNTQSSNKLKSNDSPKTRSNKRSPSAYSNFVKAVYDELRYLPYTQRIGEAAKRWRALSPEAKAKFEN